MASRIPQTSAPSMARQICDQIAAVFANSTTTTPPLSILVDEISAASDRNGGVFVYGVGREGLMMRALCMRLGHLGMRAYCVFDMTTPPIGPGDILLASAGPGGFSTVDAICGVARSNGGRVVLLTARPDLVRMEVDVVGHVGAQTMADDEVAEVGSTPSVLPMGSLYEGALYVLFEMVVFELTKVLGQNPSDVRSRHTNLE